MWNRPASHRAERRAPPALRPTSLSLAFALVLAACGGGEPSGPPPPPTLTLQGGGDQEGPVGLVLPAAVAVQLRDRKGPVVSASVRFEVTSGGGTVSPATTLTDANGAASAQWLLGGTLGRQTLQVTSGGGGRRPSRSPPTRPSGPRRSWYRWRATPSSRWWAGRWRFHRGCG